MDDLSKKEKLLLEEWKQARSSIARFDEYLLDLRKYGFTLATALLAADAYISTTVTLPPWAIAGAAIVVMILIFALFLLDLRTKLLLEIVLERAAKLEDSLDEAKLALSKNRIERGENWHIKNTGLATYIFFLIAAGVIGGVSVFAADIVEDACWALHKLLPLVLVVVWCLGSCVITFYWDEEARESFNKLPGKLKKRITDKRKGGGGTTNDQGANRNIQR